eukprot:1140333-Pelagomonas_calceolata.AAC.3
MPPSSHPRSSFDFKFQRLGRGGAAAARARGPFTPVPPKGPGAAPVGVAVPSKREFPPLQCEPPSIRCPCLCGGDGRAAPSAARGSPGAGAHAGQPQAAASDADHQGSGANQAAAATEPEPSLPAAPAGGVAHLPGGQVVGLEELDPRTMEQLSDKEICRLLCEHAYWADAASEPPLRRQDVADTLHKL